MGNSGSWTPPPASGNNEWTSDVFGKGMSLNAGGAWSYEPNLPNTGTDEENSEEPGDI